MSEGKKEIRVKEKTSFGHDDKAKSVKETRECKENYIS